MMKRFTVKQLDWTHIYANTTHTHTHSLTYAEIYEAWIAPSHQHKTMTPFLDYLIDCTEVDSTSQRVESVSLYYLI